MTASLVIGSSIVMTVTSGPQVFGLPVFTVLGLLG
jgi:ubiquinone biosynthesis protein